jgi:peptidoglycan/xylan/chitin deacetylase (PgdA/CDA1 family)
LYQRTSFAPKHFGTCAAAICSVVIDGKKMKPSQLPVILTFHSISEGDSPLNISPALFAEQMAWLKSNAHVRPLGEVVACLLEHRALPERTVVLTFDDGFRNFLGSAVPVLRRYDFRATIFLPSGYCGGTNSWPGQPDWVQREELLSWPEIADLADRGFVFGAHTATHPMLPALSLAEAELEIQSSKVEIERHIQRSVEFFAYPFGSWNPAVRELVSKRFRAACSTGAGVIEPDAHPFALPRVDAHYVRNPYWFKKLFTRRFLTYLQTRRLIRRLRRQPEGLYARM